MLKSKIQVGRNNWKNVLWRKELKCMGNSMCDFWKVSVEFQKPSSQPIRALPPDTEPIRAPLAHLDSDRSLEKVCNISTNQNTSMWKWDVRASSPPWLRVMSWFNIQIVIRLTLYDKEVSKHHSPLRHTTKSYSTYVNWPPIGVPLWDNKPIRAPVAVLN